MASGRIKLLAAAAIVTVGAGGYFLYSVFAAQAQGDLAQAPLNVQVQVAPALIMALDDSVSMLWETLNNTRDGVFVWQDASQSFYSGSTPRGYDDGDQRYYYALPPYGRGNNTIPPIDAFGFVRSPDVNPGYFDPRIDYPTWKNANGTDYVTIDPAAALLDPRPTTADSHISGTLDLTANAESTTDNWRFRVRSGMRLPAGARIRGTCNASPSNISNTAYAALAEEKQITSTSCDLHVSYFPATFFLENPATLPAAYGYTATPIAVANPPGGRPGTLYKYEIKTGNFGNPAQYQAAIQNFANWFSFYRTRREALIGGATNSLVDVSDMRVGWFRIHNRVNVTMRDMATPAEKQTLFTEIISQMRAGGSTPTRQAVRHIGEQFKRTGTGAPVKLSCQKNAGMLFTDGYINDDGSPSPGNLDLPYGAPFADTVSHTMADIVIPYYYNSLVPGLEQNNVPVSPACASVPAPPLLPPAGLRYLDCQRNLHMNFYGIALGAMGDKFGVTYHPDPANPLKMLPDPYLNPPTWHTARVDMSPHAVDEMWHATLNTRGAMINAKSPADITTAMRNILESVATGATSSGTLAMTGSRIGTRSLSVVPSYRINNEGTDWSSTLAVAKVTADLTTGNVTDTPLWEGASKLASLTTLTRRAHTWVGTSSGTSLLSTVTNLDDFCNNPRTGMSRCTAAEITALGVDASQSIDYFLGDTTREKRNSGTLRDRTTVLGDIINSTPVVSAPTDDYGYRSLPAPYGASYNTYMTTKQSRSAMVYVGANDGMLHAFHGGINHQGTVDTANAGLEQFAYIPRAVLGHMGNLLFPYNPVTVGQKFDHRYYVDGPIVTGDAYWGGGWKTVLVGTTGAGGRSVFALNVSDPSTFNRLWEIDDQHATAAVASNIGHVLGKPVIVPFRTSGGGGAVSWKAIFGNGYNSEDGKAVLFVVDIDDGTVRMIEAVESTAPAGSNGLGNITVVDRRDSVSGFAIQDGFADTVYAADQKGAVWKFDLLAAATSISTPLFTTQAHVDSGVTYRQPIIGGLTATAGGAGGVMLMFGTGSFSFNGDAGDSSIQTIYGVRDAGGSTTLTTSDLFARNMVVVPGATTRTITANAMGVGYKGWYLNLPAGERMVGYPRVASGVLFIPTYAPTTADGCSTGGENWLYGLDTRTGAPALAGVRLGSITGTTQGAAVGAIKIPTGGSAPVKDIGVSVLSTSKPIDPTLPRCWMRVTVPGMTQAMFVPYPCGRQSWRQLQ